MRKGLNTLVLVVLTIGVGEEPSNMAETQLKQHLFAAGKQTARSPQQPTQCTCWGSDEVLLGKLIANRCILEITSGLQAISRIYWPLIFNG